MKKLAILGHFGGSQTFLDGQTIKTKMLYDALKQNTNWNIVKIDTYDKRKRPFKLALSFFRSALGRDVFIVLLSGNGMRTFFPLLAFFSKHWDVKVFHDVIGGNLDQYVKKYPLFSSYLNDFQGNWVETEQLKRSLERAGIHNCIKIPNFKNLEICEEPTPGSSLTTPAAFCTFSRVMKEKGIEDAINTVNEINRRAGKTRCTLDIYGMIDNVYRKEFERVLSSTGPAIKYCGAVDASESVQTLKAYDALLFPTKWWGEGVPGTIIDAYCAGIPVLASDWNANRELVFHKSTGLVYPTDEIVTLNDAIEWVLAHRAETSQMRGNCLREARKFAPEAVISQIIAEVKKEVEDSDGR